MENFEALKKRMADVVNLVRVGSILDWDLQVSMPPGGATERANQIATLEKIRHETFVADETAQLLEAAEKEVDDLPDDADEKAMVKVNRRDYEQATRLPTAFVEEFARTTSLAHDVWVKARENDDFEAFRPSLEKIVDLCRRRAEYLGYQEHLYDALLDSFEPEATTAQVEKIFAGLREELVPFVQQIFERQERNTDEPLHRHFPIEKQREFGLMVAQALGYDLSRGRQDVAVHPFCTTFAQGDVRITTRFDERFLSPALFGTIHEAGHAMYEQGVNPALEGTILSDGTSLGVHESQSRMWENIVGRSRDFWEHFYPQLQLKFDGTLDDVSLESFYRAINYVQPSLIRVEADEVTYCLHIMLRFELEIDLLTEKLAVKDLPEAWNAKMESYLGIVPPTNREGVLQDVHWSSGILGYFPTYALGTLLSAQLYEAALQAHPNIPFEIAQGKFDTLLQWNREHVHQHGRKYTPAELTKRATGQPLQHDAFMRYLRTKYGEIYEL